jgi:hypothetical protein
MEAYVAEHAGRSLKLEPLRGEQSELALTFDGRLLFRSYSNRSDASAKRDGWSRLTDLVDVKTGRTDAAVRSFLGQATPFFSGDGNVLAINSARAVRVLDRSSGTTEVVPEATSGGQPNGPTGVRWVSRNGRFLIIDSEATNLVGGITPPATGTAEYVYDRGARTLELLTQDPVGALPKRPCGGLNYGSRAVAVSDDGEWAVFDCEDNSFSLLGAPANTRAHLYARHRPTGRTWLIDSAPTPTVTFGSSYLAVFEKVQIFDGGLIAVRRFMPPYDNAQYAVYWMTLPNGAKTTRRPRAMEPDTASSGSFGDVGEFSRVGCALLADTSALCPKR